MENFEFRKQIGEGMYASVSKMVRKATGEVVAVKRMKKRYKNWDECSKLREVRSLLRLRHPNIVKLDSVIRHNNQLYLVFEHMERNLFELMQANGKIDATRVRNFMFQILQGVNYIHTRGYFHRDLKPENILIRGNVLKIADFGLARELRSRPPYTEYISTRWYRAPEILLRLPRYGAPVDLWACGTIMAELCKNSPLFPGSSETDQLHKLCEILGTPTHQTWPKGVSRAKSLKFDFPSFKENVLASEVKSASTEGIELMQALLRYDPQRRITAGQALRYPYFQVGLDIPVEKKNDLSYLPPNVSLASETLQPPHTPIFLLAENKRRPWNESAPASGIMQKKSSSAVLAAGILGSRYAPPPAQ